MTATQATAEVFWTAFQALDGPEKDAFIMRLLDDSELLEDIVYAKIVDQRKSEPTVSLDDYLAGK